MSDELFNSVKELFCKWHDSLAFTFELEQPKGEVVPMYVENIRVAINDMEMCDAYRDGVIEIVNKLVSRIENRSINVMGSEDYTYPLLKIEQAMILKVNGQIIYCIPGTYQGRMIPFATLETVERPTADELEAYMIAGNSNKPMMRNFMVDQYKTE